MLSQPHIEWWKGMPIGRDLERAHACPFCAGVEQKHAFHSLNFYAVQCPRCEATGPKRRELAQAVVAWNNASAR